IEWSHGEGIPTAEFRSVEEIFKDPISRQAFREIGGLQGTIENKPASEYLVDIFVRAVQQPIKREWAISSDELLKDLSKDAQVKALVEGVVNANGGPVKLETFY